MVPSQAASSNTTLGCDLVRFHKLNQALLWLAYRGFTDRLAGCPTAPHSIPERSTEVLSPGSQREDSHFGLVNFNQKIIRDRMGGPVGISSVDQ